MEPKTLFSIIVLVPGGSHFLPATLDTLKFQVEKDFEVLLMDREGSGRLREIATQYPELRFSYHKTTGKNESEMMNAGMRAAQGKYLQFLHPGDRFISQYGLSHLRELIEKGEEPHLAYGGFLSYGIDQLPQALSSPMSLENLKKGIFPASNRATWFLKQTIVELGGFDARFSHHSSFDFLCRLFKKEPLRTVCSQRVLTDSEPHKKTAREHLSANLETFRILYLRFGAWSAIRWIFAQDLAHVFRSSLRFLKHAFMKE